MMLMKLRNYDSRPAPLADSSEVAAHACTGIKIWQHLLAILELQYNGVLVRLQACMGTLLPPLIRSCMIKSMHVIAGVPGQGPLQILYYSLNSLLQSQALCSRTHSGSQKILI